MTWPTDDFTRQMGWARKAATRAKGHLSSLTWRDGQLTWTIAGGKLVAHNPEPASPSRRGVGQGSLL